MNVAYQTPRQQRDTFKEWLNNGHLIGVFESAELDASRGISPKCRKKYYLPLKPEKITFDREQHCTYQKQKLTFLEALNTIPDEAYS